MQHCSFALVAPETAACCVAQALTTLMRTLNRSAHNEWLAHCWFLGCCSHGAVLVMTGLYTRCITVRLVLQCKTRRSRSSNGFLIRYCRWEIWALTLIPVLPACGLLNDCTIIRLCVSHRTFSSNVCRHTLDTARYTLDTGCEEIQLRHNCLQLSISGATAQ